jgi:hypothetical protein
MRLEVIAMLGYLARTLARLLTPAAGDRIQHGELPHAHWDRRARRWVAHESEPELAEAA